MNLFDRVRLLVRSTLNSALRGNLPEVAISEHDEKLMDKAQAQIEILQQDAARAEKRGDAELANRLKREITELQALLDKARRRAIQAQPQKPEAQEAAGAPTQQGQPARAEVLSGESTQVPDETSTSVDQDLADRIRRLGKGD
jgi:hypothetical protein